MELNTEIQVLIDWLQSEPVDANPHKILTALAIETRKSIVKSEAHREFEALDLVAMVNDAAEKRGDQKPYKGGTGDWDYEKAKEFIDNANIKVFFEKRLSRYIQFAKASGYSSDVILVPSKTKTAGKNRVKYFLEKKNISDLVQKEVDDGSELLDSAQNHASDTDIPITEVNVKSSVINYERNDDVKIGFIARTLFFQNGKAKLKTWRGWMLLGFLLAVIAVASVLWFAAWLSLTQSQQLPNSRLLLILFSLVGIPYAAWRHGIFPWVRAFDDRIAPVPEWLTSLGEKRRAQLEVFDEGKTRIVSVVRYTGNCPQCEATVYLDDGDPDFPRRMIGRCSDSPREHIYSFDRVTGSGYPLRQQYCQPIKIGK